MRLYPSPLFTVAAKDRFRFDESIIGELRLLTDNINQNPFKNLTAVIYHNLKKNGYLKKLPSELLKRLKEAYYNALLLDMHQRGWLENFIKNLLPKDVTIILLKGSANWGTIYSPEAPRTGCDIDILVREEDFERIVGIMDKIADKHIIDESRPFSNVNAYEYSYKIKDSPVGVEIHRRISYPFVGKVDYDNLFSKSLIHPFYKKDNVRILSPEERLVNTFIHTLKHADINAHEVVDSYRIMKKYGIKHDNIIKISKKYGLSNYAGLLLSSISYVTDESEKLPSQEGIRGKIFEILHYSDIKIRFRVRQVLSMFLLDNINDVFHFAGFYFSLRMKDILYNYLYSVTGKNYAE